MNYKVFFFFLSIILLFTECSKTLGITGAQTSQNTEYTALPGINDITVDCSSIIGTVNKKIFGNNCLAHDPSQTTSEPWAIGYVGYSNYGAGLWDPVSETTVPEPIQLIKDAGITMLRFPGGCGSHGYDWTNAVVTGRTDFKFGLCEFYQVCNETSADAVITLSYFSDTPESAADLVSFLNTPYNAADEAYYISQGKTYWPGIRKQNGYNDPLNFKYFEIGNEVFHGNHKDITSVTASDYAARYLQYYDAMKAVDPTVQIGIVLDNQAWNDIVIPAIASKVDFGILHTYPAPGYGAALEALPVEDLFLMCLGIPEKINEPFYQTTLTLLKNNASKDVPLAITEYNGGFFMHYYTVHYPFTMGNALINAELIKYLMKPSNKILMANNWDLINESTWSMIYNGFYQEPSTLYNSYHKRPNYYIYELYKNHFGSRLLSTTVKSATYEKEGYTVDYLSANASLSDDGNKVYLIIINKNLTYKLNTKIHITGLTGTNTAQAWILNGPSYLSVNDEVSMKNVNLTSSLDNSGDLSIELEPHSLTAIEINK